MLQYSGTEKFPISLLASVMVYGADKKITSTDAAGNVILSTDNNYSLYFEVGYSHTMSNDVSLDLFAGVVPVESYYYGVTDFSLINLGLKASKSIKITDDFSLPINLSIITNPDSENVFFVFGISL